MSNLKANTITNAAGTGAPTFTYHVNKVSMKYTSNGGLALSGTMSTVTYETLVWDTDSAYSGGVFTSPKAARYHFKAGCLTAGVSLSTSQTVQIQGYYNNTTAIDQSVVYGNGTLASWGALCVGSVYLGIGDTLRIRLSCDASTTVSSGASYFNCVSIWEE